MHVVPPFLATGRPSAATVRGRQIVPNCRTIYKQGDENASDKKGELYSRLLESSDQLSTMSADAELEKNEFGDTTSDDAVLEQLGYTQGTCRLPWRANPD